MGKPRVERPGAFFFARPSTERAPRLRHFAIGIDEEFGGLVRGVARGLEGGASVEHVPGPLRVGALIRLLSPTAPLCAEGVGLRFEFGEVGLDGGVGVGEGLEMLCVAGGVEGDGHSQSGSLCRRLAMIVGASCGALVVSYSPVEQRDVPEIEYTAGPVPKDTADTGPPLPNTARTGPSDILTLMPRLSQ